MSDEVPEEVVRFARTLYTAWAQLQERAERARAEADRQQAARLQDATRTQEQQFTQWVTSQQEKYRRVGWADWEDKATPQQWADAYVTARGMRDYDPKAVAAANRIEREYQRRFGVDIRENLERYEESERLRREAQQRATGPVSGESVQDFTRTVRPEYARVSDPQWANAATVEDWKLAYLHARVVADQNLDPVARMAVPRIEDEVRSRFGADIRAAYDQAVMGWRERQADATSRARADQHRAEEATDEATTAREHGAMDRRELGTRRDWQQLTEAELVDAVAERARQSLSNDSTLEQWRDAVGHAAQELLHDHPELSPEARQHLEDLSAQAADHSQDGLLAERHTQHTVDEVQHAAHASEQAKTKATDSALTETRTASEATHAQDQSHASQLSEAEVDRAEDIVQHGSASYESPEKSASARRTTQEQRRGRTQTQSRNQVRTNPLKRTRGQG